MKLRDKRNNAEIDSDPESIEKLLRRARQRENRQNLHFHRRRVLYNVYYIEIWSDDPDENPNAVHLYNIEGAKRLNLNAHPTPIRGRRGRRPDHRPRPRP